ncbi:hypothetical protein LBMAG53_08270 [Planctomycetota bacterium]|nr:hypothetical protein LBMAG53_08270 [Planctomycetota bacterium]
MTLRDIFEGAFYSVMLRGRERSQAWDMYQVLRWGFFPLYWKGIWPKGYCLAYCPAELPHAKVPAECVPTPEQLADGDRKRAKPTPMPPCPDYPATSPEGWKELVDRPDRATAFRQHFSPFIHTSDGNELLDLLGKQVSAFKVQGKKLIVQFGGDAYMACKPPWTGSLAAVPPTVGAVIRVHNGMSLFHSGGEADEWRTFNGKTFPHSDWRDWWEGDPDDSDNPFPKMPLIPITTTDGSGLWIIHPDKRLPNGEPAAVYLDARLGDPDPRPIGEIWLEIIASTLTLMDAMKRR